jgi:hypothetical protein
MGLEDDDSGEFIVPFPDGSETLEEALEHERINQVVDHNNQVDDED